MSNNVSDLMTAYRLMRKTEELTARHTGKESPAHRMGKKTEKDPLLDELDQDLALLSGGQSEATRATTARSVPPPEDLSIKLSDLLQRLKDLKANLGEASHGMTSETTVFTATQVTTEIAIEFKARTPVEGLVRNNANQAETDRYLFDFSDGATFKITDKWANKSTTIWGDPHVDVSDVEGNRDGEFSDLKSSNTQTTLMLQDGTQVTFTAKDNGVIEAVDLFKGQQHLNGVGAGSKEWGEQNMLFVKDVTDDGQSALSQLPRGDVVYAGGDGADWFDVSGRLVWGKTTAPAPSAPPAYSLQIAMQQTVTQVAYMQTVDRRF